MAFPLETLITSDQRLLFFTFYTARCINLNPCQRSRHRDSLLPYTESTFSRPIASRSRFLAQYFFNSAVHFLVGLGPSIYIYCILRT